MIIQHRDGTTREVHSITAADAALIPLAPGWAFGTIEAIPTFKPLVAPTDAPKPDRKPKTLPDPLILRAIREWFAPGIEGTKRKFCDDTLMAFDVASHGIDHLLGTGELVATKEGGKTYRAKAAQVGGAA